VGRTVDGPPSRPPDRGGPATGDGRGVRSSTTDHSTRGSTAESATAIAETPASTRKDSSLVVPVGDGAGERLDDGPADEEGPERDGGRRLGDPLHLDEVGGEEGRVPLPDEAETDHRARRQHHRTARDGGDDPPHGPAVGLPVVAFVPR
jgi:hypothetical protein